MQAASESIENGASTAAGLYRRSERAARVALAVTLGLAAAKLAGGWLGHSLALISDAVHSLGDALSSAAILVALRFSQHPPDREHPYGHTRSETIVASNIALVLIASGLWLAYEAVRTWNAHAEVPASYTLAIALASVILNEWCFRYSISIARETGSQAVAASAWDQRLDVFSSLVVLVGLLVTRWAGPAWHNVDHVAALVVSGIIVVAAGGLFWSSFQELMDRQAGPAMLAQIRGLAGSVSGVRGIEKLLVRKAGLEHFVDIHVEVAPEITVREGHDIGHAVKDLLLAEIPTVKDVLVHIEPAPGE